MMSNQSAQKKLKILLQQLERGISNLKSSEAWKNYLRMQSRFHDYSFSNVMLILMQQPNATRVAGYKAWQKMKRQVRLGEEGIRIIAPCKVVREDEDEKTGNIKQKNFLYFRTVTVFDISQTDGGDPPDVCFNLQGDSYGNLLVGLKKLAEGKGLTVEFSRIKDDLNGFYLPSRNKIVVSSERERNQQVKTLIHEIAHAILHSDELSIEKASREIEAESVAYVVLSYFGFDSSDYSFGYVAKWSQEEDHIQKLKELGDRIQGASKEIITGLRCIILNQ